MRDSFLSASFCTNFPLLSNVPMANCLVFLLYFNMAGRPSTSTPRSISSNAGLPSTVSAWTWSIPPFSFLFPLGAEITWSVSGSGVISGITSGVGSGSLYSSVIVGAASSLANSSLAIFAAPILPTFLVSSAQTPNPPALCESFRMSAIWALLKGVPFSRLSLAAILV